MYEVNRSTKHLQKTQAMLIQFYNPLFVVIEMKFTDSP